MSSRIRSKSSVKKLFICYISIDPPPSFSDSDFSYSSNSLDVSSVVKTVYPPSFKDADVLKTAVQFALPCFSQTSTVDLFTFVLTSVESQWTFGYCRHPPPGELRPVTLFLSFLPWQEIFYRALNYSAELSSSSSTPDSFIHSDLYKFIDRLYSSPVPDTGTCLYVPLHPKPFICPTPSEFSLPSIPENRNVSEFYNALGTESMLVLFSSIISERRIVVTSKKLSRLSSIIITANLFIYPMAWQHIFIPVLPAQLVDYLSAPMPYLIGVPSSVWDGVSLDAVGQVVHVDGDSDSVSSPFPEDLSSLPPDILIPLRKSLKGDRVLGDGLARAFLRALAQLMGHYQDAVREDSHTFDKDLFVHFAHPSHRAYISERVLKLQIFAQFIEERLDKMKSGSCESDEFELEALAWRSHSKSTGKNGIPALRTISSAQNHALKKAGRAVMSSVKRESGHFIESVKQNSALKSAIRSVKEGGKSVKQKSHIAISDIRSKFHVTLPITPNLPISDSAHSSLAKTYQNKLQIPHNSSSSSNSKLENIALAHELETSLKIENGNLMNCSVSASNLPSIEPAGISERVKRMSKSEENLIDLEEVYNIENPLYEYSTVFEDSGKTDEELLTEYGLNDYFTKLTLSNATGSSISHSNTSSLNSSLNNDIIPSSSSLQSSSFTNSSLNITNFNLANGTESNKWATFE